VILDRPNPIGGEIDTMEGRLQGEAFRSFVGLEAIPIRHALTLGELVAWRRDVERLDVDLTIVRCEWDRELGSLGARFVMPSPNMPTIDTALVYPGACLVEGTNLSEGRGTTRPFEIVGAPFVDGVSLARALSDTKLPGFVARAIRFVPTFHKHASEACGGVQLHVTDARTFKPVATYVALVALAYQQSPDRFRFRTERYEFIDHIPAFDLLSGHSEARERITRGDSPLDVATAISSLRTGETHIWHDAREAALAYSR
jgi:uncharacterized protein YbbC (DUF1343 family)